MGSIAGLQEEIKADVFSPFIALQNTVAVHFKMRQHENEIFQLTRIKILDMKLLDILIALSYCTEVSSSNL